MMRAAPPVSNTLYRTPAVGPGFGMGYIVTF